MMTHTDLADDTPESVGMEIVRCPGCGKVHIGMMDTDDLCICEMTLEDDDVIRMAVQLLRAVYPMIDVNVLVAKIKAAANVSIN